MDPDAIMYGDYYDDLERERLAGLEERERKAALARGLASPAAAAIREGAERKAIGESEALKKESDYNALCKTSEPIAIGDTPIKLDIPIYVDRKNDKVILGNIVTKNLKAGVPLPGQEINSSTPIQTISEVIQATTAGPALDSFREAYGNITNTERKPNEFEKATGLYSSSLNKLIGVTGEYDRRRKDQSTSLDVRTFLNKIRVPPPAGAPPGTVGSLPKPEYEKLFTLANPAKYPGTEWQNQFIDGKSTKDIWADVRANYTATAKSSITAFGNFTGDEITRKAIEKLNEVIARTPRLKPELKQVLTDIKDSIVNKTDYIAFGPKPTGWFSSTASWPGFKYNEELLKRETSKFVKLTNNLNAMNFERKTIIGPDGLGYYLPGFNYMRENWIEEPKQFADKLLNAGRLFGGRHTRKNKKSKTQKGGKRRGNKKSKKH
jgi:hypothetical protein